MAVYGFLNEGLIKNIKDSRAAAAQKKEDKARVKEEEAEYKKLVPKVQAADKKAKDKYAKDPTIRKKMASLIKSYLKKMEDDPKLGLDDWEVEDCQYYIEHPEEIDIKYYPKEVQYDYANGGCISINITDASAAVATAINSVVCAIGKDIAKELGDIGTPYTITGPNLDEDDFGTCYFKFKGSQNESAINEGVAISVPDVKKNYTLNSEQKKEYIKILDQVKRIAPALVDKYNKDSKLIASLKKALSKDLEYASMGRYKVNGGINYKFVGTVSEYKTPNLGGSAISPDIKPGEIQTIVIDIYDKSINKALDAALKMTTDEELPEDDGKYVGQNIDNCTRAMRRQITDEIISKVQGDTVKLVNGNFDKFSNDEGNNTIVLIVAPND